MLPLPPRCPVRPSFHWRRLSTVASGAPCSLTALYPGAVALASQLQLQQTVALRRPLWPHPPPSTGCLTQRDSEGGDQAAAGSAVRPGILPKGSDQPPLPRHPIMRSPAHCARRQAATIICVRSRASSDGKWLQLGNDPVDLRQTVFRRFAVDNRWRYPRQSQYVRAIADRDHEHVDERLRPARDDELSGNRPALYCSGYA